MSTSPKQYFSLVGPAQGKSKKLHQESAVSLKIGRVALVASAAKQESKINSLGREAGRALQLATHQLSYSAEQKGMIGRQSGLLA